MTLQEAIEAQAKASARTIKCFDAQVLGDPIPLRNGRWEVDLEGTVDGKQHKLRGLVRQIPGSENVVIAINCRILDETSSSDHSGTA